MKAIITQYHGPSNTKGSRVTASDSDGNRISVEVENHKCVHDAHVEAVLKLCRKMDWNGCLVEGSLGKSNVWVWLQSPDAVLKTWEE